MKKNQRKGFTKVENHVLDNNCLTLEEKGMIALLLSNKEDGPDYKVNIEEIFRRSKGHADTQRKVFQKLKDWGFVTQEKTMQKGTGKFVWNYKINGQKVFSNGQKPDPKKPDMNLPAMELPALVSAPLVKPSLVPPVLDNTEVNKTNDNYTNLNNNNLNKTKEKEQASKLNQTELLCLNENELKSIEPEKQTEIETVACWPDFFPIEEKEEMDFQSLIFEPITEELAPPVLEDFPYESHMAPNEEVPSQDTIDPSLSTYAESEPFAVSMESDLLQGTKPMDTVILEAKSDEYSVLQLDVTRLNGKANLSLEEKQEIFDFLKLKFSERESEFSSFEVYAQSVRDLATKLHNAEFKPGNKVINSWPAYLSAAIQGIINDLNKKEIEEEEEWLKKKIRNMRAEGYEYVDGQFVDTKNVAGLKYGNK
jgi:hypothetical protein